MPKHKAGLHKQVSSIFTGIPIPKDDGAKDQNSTATKEPQTYGPPSHLSGRPVEPPQPTKSPQKAVPAKKPKADEKEAPKIQAPPEIKPARPAVLEQAIQRIKDKLFAPKEGVSPTRQKAMVVLVPALFIGMVLAFFKVLGPGPDKTTGPKIFTPSNAIAASTSTIDWQIPPPYPTTLRDPMRFTPVAPTADQDEPGGLIVKGIVYGEDSSFAIIGTEIVHEGGTVSGATVVKINPDSVEFEMNGKRWTQKVQ